ncbi:sensor histidine kinase N-terminal domain-containing protein [soil metagenome]
MIFSIRISLLKWLIVPLLMINIIGAGLTYWLAWAPAQIAFDQGLADTAWALMSRLRDSDGSIAIDLPQQAEQVLRVNHFDSLYFTVRNASGKTITGDKDFIPLQLPATTDETFAYDGIMHREQVRVITLKTKIGAETISIGVAETDRKRSQIRNKIFFTLLLLEGFLTLVLISAVWFAVTKGLLPLKKMQSDLDARNYNDLSSVKQNQVPLELLPVVKAINGLLSKVQMDASARQNFLANVAHQLRTPLAGLKTQIEWMAQKHHADADTTQATKLMMSSTERMIRQTNQLLVLARAEPGQFQQTRLENVELHTLIEESVQHFVEMASKKDIDLGFQLEPTLVMGDQFLLRDMIDNLIDNAIRYTPPFGAVTVSCFNDALHGIFSVEDSGAGIAPSERDLIFNRFYRLSDQAAGSGLGLAIVRDIAKDHNAKIVLTSAAGGKGTVFSVQFSRAPTPPADD